jgi:hypothetical protein
VTSLLRTVRRRIRNDFLMPSRMPEYEQLLSVAIAAGYRVMSIEQYWSESAGHAAGIEAPILILRHDIDTDLRTARQMWAIDVGLGVRSSHFFRLSTLDRQLMREIETFGARASYHYEELATVARRRRPRTREEAERLVPEARDLFAANLARLRARTGLAMEVVASHGDFLNRRLGINNWAILADPDFRREMGILLEPYDPSFLATVTSYHRDLPPPERWMDADLLDAISRREAIVYALIHPRPWQVNRRENLRDDLVRALDEVSYRLPVPRPRA